MERREGGSGSWRGGLTPPTIPPYNGAMEQLRVVVVDDHPIYRCGLVGLLEAGGVAVAGVADGVEGAMAVVRATRPDAVLTDLYLSDGSGIELVKRVGAHDFLTKEQAPERLVRALEGVFVGEAALSRQMTGYLVRDLRDGDRRVALASHFPHRERLTPRQLEILQLIASGHSTAVIAQRLCLSPETVRWHVKSILRKLRAKNRAEAAATLREIAV